MKKYVFGLVAMVMAIGMVAFTEKGKSDKKVKLRATTNFYYFPPEENDYSEESVEDKDNWKSIGGDPLDCTNTPEKACLIEVNDDYTELDVNNVRVFRTSVMVANIIAQPGNADPADHIPDLSLSTGLDGKSDKPQ